MAELDRVRVWADALIRLHLAGGDWTFRFDNAKTRAGQCNHSKREITVSKYLAARFDDDEIHQILLHEVAHAIAGPRAAHGRKWLATARELGYVGKRTHDGPVAEEFANWIGTCPAGHTIVRFRKPKRAVSCGKCARGFSRAHLITWTALPKGASRTQAQPQLLTQSGA